MGIREKILESKKMKSGVKAVAPLHDYLNKQMSDAQAARASSYASEFEKLKLGRNQSLFNAALNGSRYGVEDKELEARSYAVSLLKDSGVAPGIQNASLAFLQRKDVPAVTSSKDEMAKALAIDLPTLTKNKQNIINNTADTLLDIEAKRESGEYTNEELNAMYDAAKAADYSDAFGKAVSAQKTARDSLTLSKYGNYAWDAKHDAKNSAPKSLADGAIKDVQTFKYINDVEGFRSKMIELDKSGVTFGDYDYMRDDEIDTYNYIVNTQGESVAKDYLNALSKSLADRRVKKVEESAAYNAEHYPVLSSAASILATPIKGVGAISSLVSSALGNGFDEKSRFYDVSRWQSGVREGVSKNMSDVGSFIYNTGMSIGDSALSMSLGEVGSLAVFGTGAATDTIRDVKERGGSDAQALTVGILAGAAEVFFERYSVESFIKLTSPAAKGAVIKNTLKQAGIEASEEVLTEIANTITDSIGMGELSNFNTAISAYMADGMSREDAEKRAYLDIAKNVGLAGLGGALSGGVMGGFGGAIGNYNTAQYGKSIKGDAEYTKLLMDAAQNADTGSDFYSASQAIAERQTNNKNPRNLDYGRLGVAAEEYSNGDTDVLYRLARQKAESDAENARSVEAQKNAEEEALADTTLSERAEVPAKAVEATPEEMPAEEHKPDDSAAQKGTEGIDIAPVTRTANAADAATGARYTVQGISSIKDGKAALRVTDGASVREVSADELHFDNTSDANIYYAAAQTGDVELANAIIENYDGEHKANVFAKAFSEYYKAGANGSSFSVMDAAISDGYGRFISSAAKQAAFYAGRQSASASSGVIRNYDATKTLPKFKRKQLNAIDKIAKHFGVRVIVEDGIASPDGKQDGANGYYDADTKEIHVSLSNPDAAIMATFTHELTHHLQNTNSTAFDELKSFVFNELSKNDAFVLDDRVNELIELYERHGKTLSRDMAEEEIICNALDAILTNKEAVSRLVQENASLARRILDFINSFIDELTNSVFAHALSGNHTETIALIDEADTLNRMADMLREGLEGAEKSASGDVKYSINPDFASEYDAWDKVSTKGYFVLGATSEALRSIDIGARAIQWDKSKIVKIREKHSNMTDAVIKQVPNILEYPVLIMKSKQAVSRIVLFGEVYDANNVPVLAVLELRPKVNQKYDLDVIKVASAYGKDTNPQKLINESEILYVDSNKERADSWLEGTRLQLPFNLKSYDSINKVAYKNPHVNDNIRDESENNTSADTKRHSLTPPAFSLESIRTVYGERYASIGKSGLRELFDAAKGGDMQAARELVEKAASTEFVEKIRDRFKGCVSVPVTRSAAGSNVIPAAFAERIGMEVNSTVRLVGEVQKKSEGKFARLFVKSRFAGGAELKGKNVVIVDDVLSSGGTAAELAAYLEANGAKVRGVVALFKGKNATDNLAMSANQRADIERLIGIERVESALGRKIDTFTNREAEVILNNRGDFVDPAAELERERGRKYEIKDYSEHTDVRYSASDKWSASLGMDVLTKETENNIKQRGGVIVHNRSALLEYINEATSGSKKANIFLGGITLTAIASIERDLNINVFKNKTKGQYSFCLSYDDIRHIAKHSATDNETVCTVEKVCLMISSYDAIAYETRDNGGSRLIITKAFEDADYLTVDMVANKNRNIDLVTVYTTKKRKGSQVNPPATQSSLQRDSASDDKSIAPVNTPVNDNVHSKGENYTDARFSLSTATPGLREQLDEARENKLNDDEIEKLAKNIIKTTHSEYDRTKLVDKLNAAFDGFFDKELSGDERANEYIERFGALMREVTDKSRVEFDKSMRGEMRKSLRGLTIKLTEKEAADIRKAYGSVKAFRQMMFGRTGVNFSLQSGTGLDVIIHELPDIKAYFPDAASVHISEFADFALRMQEREYFNPYAGEMSYADAAELFLAEYLNLPRIQNAVSKTREASALDAARITEENARREALAAAYENADSDGRRAIIEVNIKELVDRYGAIEKGANPKVDIDVPVKTSPDKNTRRFVRTVLESGELTSEMSLDVQEEILSEALSYNVETDAQSRRFAERYVRNEKKTAEGAALWDSFVNGNVGREALTRPGEFKHMMALGQYLLKAAAENGAHQDVIKLVAELSEVGTCAGQAVQALSMLKKLGGVGQLYYVTRAVRRLQNDIDAKTDKMPTKQREKFMKQLGGDGKIKIDPKLAEDLANALGETGIKAATRTLIRSVAEQLPSTWDDRWNAWRYLSMLMNPRTHIRNLVGNAIFIPAVSLKNTLAVPLEAAMNAANKKNGGIERTKAVAVSKKYVDFAKGDFSAMLDTLRGGGKMNPADMLRDERRIFNAKWLEKLRTMNSNLLENEDVIFLRLHYITALSQYLQANKIDVATLDTVEGQGKLGKARAYAVKEAQKATYRDASVTANALSRLAHTNKVLGAFVEGVIPFKKTPINILKRGIEYSPAGLLYKLTKGVSDLRRGKISASEWIDGVAAGLSGTAILAVGMLLRSLGVVVGGFGDDKDDEFRELTGEQEYALRIGDTSYTLDWLAPVSMPFFVGVELYSAIEQGFDGITLKEAFDAIMKIGEPAFNMSMLSGVNNLVAAADNSDNPIVDISIEAVTSYVSQALPTLFGQIARTYDDTQRRTYADKNSPLPDDLQRFIQKIMKKLPYVSTLLTPWVDEWGETDTTKEWYTRALENFISPGYASTVEMGNAEIELAALHKRTGDDGVLPSVASKCVTVDSKRIDFTAKQYTEYATIRGKTALGTITGIIESARYKALSDEDKAEAIKDAYTYAGEIAKDKLTDSGVIKWVDEARKSGDVSEYIIQRTLDAVASAEKSEAKRNAVEAIESGDYAAAKNEIAAYVDGGGKVGGIKSELSEQYKEQYIELVRSGKKSEAKKIADKLLAVEELEYTEDDISCWVTDAVRSELYDIIDSGKTFGIRAKVRELQKYGAEDKNIKSALTRMYKTKFIELYKTDKSAAQKLKEALIATGLYKYEDINKWK